MSQLPSPANLLNRTAPLRPPSVPLSNVSSGELEQSSIASVRSMPGGTEVQNSHEAVAKCARFFKTLLRLSEKQQQSQDTVNTVRQLVRGVVFGTLSPEDFTVCLQQALNSHAQQNLLPFLRQTLPALRTALLNGEQVIEGIGTADEYKAEVAAEIPSDPVSPAISTSNISYNNQIEPSSSFVPMLAPSAPVLIPNVQSTPVTSASIHVAPISQNSTSVSNPSVIGQIVPDNFSHTCLNSQAIVNRIYARMPECEGIDDEAIRMISNAAEEKLRALTIKLSLAAEHRLEPLRLNLNYKQVDDPRKQLRYVEEVERRIYERRETIEREALLKISKSKGKDKDTIERVKQIQKADKEAALNREANEAAIAALGGGLRGTKRPNSSNNVLQQSVGAGLSLQTHKPRIKRISARDLQLVLSTDAYASKTNVFYRLCYLNPSLTSNTGTSLLYDNSSDSGNGKTTFVSNTSVSGSTSMNDSSVFSSSTTIGP